MRTSRTCTEFAAINFSRSRSLQLVELEHARIAKRIKQARKEAGLTQQQVADLLGVIQRTYQNYESQTAPRIPWDRLNDIARVTSVKVEWLLHGDSPDLMGTLNGNGPSAQLDRIEAKLDDLLKRSDEAGRDEADRAVQALADEGSSRPSKKPATGRAGRA